MKNAIFRSASTIMASLIVALLVVPAAAQPGFRSGGAGIMMGPGMMGRMMGAGMCNPSAAGLAEWRVAAIERTISPTDTQRAALEELKSASKKAAETIASACPRELPTTATARLALMEKRLDAMLQAVKTVRPAFDDFYATLTEEQKVALNKAGPRRWGWRSWQSGR